MSTTPAFAAVPDPADRVIPLNLIDPSPFNPRKTFDGIEELAASIAEHGQLQAGTVRPVKDRFELMGGERRYRALKHNKAAGMRVRVREATDAEARAIQLVENLQRADIPVLEEARGFAELQDQDPKKWTPDAIGKSVSKTARFVQQRLAIHRGLAPDLKKQVAAGALNVEVARTIAMAPPAMQVEIAQNSYNMASADRVREQILARVIPVSAAAFPREKYEGETIDKQGREQFLDVPQFMKLQNAVVQSMAEKLKADWPKVKIVANGELYDWAWADTGERIANAQGRTKASDVGPNIKNAPKEKQSAILWIGRDGKIGQALGVVPATSVKITATASGASHAPPREAADHRKARLAFLESTRKAVAADSLAALRLTVAALLSDHGRLGHDSMAKAAEHIASQRLRSLLTEGYSETRALRAWNEVRTLGTPELLKILAAFAGFSVAWSGHEPKPSAFAVAVAAAIGVSLPAPEKAKDEKPKAAAKAKPKAKKPAAKKKAAKK